MKESAWKLILVIIISNFAFSQSINDIKNPIWRNKNITEFVGCRYIEIDEIVTINDSVIDMIGSKNCGDGLESQGLIISLNDKTGKYLNSRKNEPSKIINSNLVLNFNEEKYLSKKKIYKIESKFKIINREVTLYSKWFHSDSLYLYIKVFNIDNKKIMTEKLIDTIGHKHHITTRLTDDNYLTYFSNSSKVTVNLTNGEKSKSRNNKLYSNVIDYEKINQLEIITKPTILIFKKGKKTYKVKNYNSENGGLIYIHNNTLYILRENILTKHKLNFTT